VIERCARRMIAIWALRRLAESRSSAVPAAVVRLQTDNRSVLRSSELVLAQLARGPPAMAWEKTYCQPSFYEGSVRARSFA
jgi:hypothetical protein